MGYRRNFAELIRQAIELDKQGLTTYAIATKLKVNERVIYEWLAKARDNLEYVDGKDLVIFDEEELAYKRILGKVELMPEGGQICCICGKLYYPFNLDWAYRIKYPRHKYVCSYHCQIEAERNVQKHMIVHKGGGWIRRKR